MVYNELRINLEEIIGTETNFIANASNFASLLFNSLKEINWVGFYLLSSNELVLGPFHGKPACIRIPFGKGVCGAAAKNRKTLVVDDVHTFPGHIACDPGSNSEIVIPLIHDDVLYGVLDIDSPCRNRFAHQDKENLEHLAKLLVDNSDMLSLSRYYKLNH